MERWIIALEILLVLMAMLAGYGVFGIVLPAKTEYNWYFDVHVQRAYSLGTFEGIKHEVMVVWRQMNITFAGRDYNETFCTPWFWEQTYPNTLTAQNEYLQKLVNKIDGYQDAHQKLLLSTTNATIRADWHQKAIQDIRAEMKVEGGLDRVIRGVYFLTYTPTAYWLSGWLIPVATILVIAIIILTSYIILHLFIFM